MSITSNGLSSELGFSKQQDLIPSTNISADLPVPATPESGIPAAVYETQLIPSTSQATSGDCADLPATTTSDLEIFQAAVYETQLISSTIISDNGVLTFPQLLPVPHRERPLIKRPRVKPPSYELTSLETLKHVSNKVKPPGKEKASKRKPLHDADQLVKKNVCQKKKSKEKIQAGNKDADNNKSSDTDNTPCAFCQWIYGDILGPLIEDNWEMCINCSKWYHYTCASVCEKFRASSFTCDNNCRPI